MDIRYTAFLTNDKERKDSRSSCTLLFHHYKNVPEIISLGEPSVLGHKATSLCTWGRQNAMAQSTWWREKERKGSGIYNLFQPCTSIDLTSFHQTTSFKFHHLLRMPLPEFTLWTTLRICTFHPWLADLFEYTDKYRWYLKLCLYDAIQWLKLWTSVIFYPLGNWFIYQPEHAQSPFICTLLTAGDYRTEISGAICQLHPFIQFLSALFTSP